MSYETMASLIMLSPIMVGAVCAGVVVGDMYGWCAGIAFGVAYLYSGIRLSR